VEHNKLISRELSISYKVLKYIHQIFNYYPEGALLKYQNKQISAEVRISFRIKF